MDITDSAKKWGGPDAKQGFKECGRNESWRNFVSSPRQQTGTEQKFSVWTQPVGSQVKKI